MQYLTSCVLSWFDVFSVDQESGEVFINSREKHTKLLLTDGQQINEVLIKTMTNYDMLLAVHNQMEYYSNILNYIFFFF